MCDNANPYRATREMSEHLDIITELRGKIFPVLVLMSHASEINPNVGEVLTKEELGNLGWLLRDLFDNLFDAIDGLNESYKRENKIM